MSALEIYGIRHHGPGSARSLLAALENTKPDIILIEGPPEAGALLHLAAHPAMRPPVALLAYNPSNLRQAAFFPFAEFSPEWQAMLFGVNRQIPVRMIDLPVAQTLVLETEDTPEVQLELELPASPPSAIIADPFAEIAYLAGYSDPERWWEAMLERNTPELNSQHEQVFSAVLELMQALREAKTATGASESRETLLREAHMRQALRGAQREGFSKIALVCGAWHTPALAMTDRIKASADAALLRGLKKMKIKTTWIPWSFDRLSRQSGYGAGVVAPAWYQLLWQRPATAEPHTQWLAMAAQLLREQGLSTAPAHVVEAVRLAETLTTLRNTQLPGIEELREAAVTALCEGGEKTYELIERQMVIGDVLGGVPPDTPLVPLRADFEAQVKSARLMLNTAPQSLALDLRETAHLRKSQLLHRLRLLDIPWGTPEAIGGKKEGRFHENWKLQWLPDYEIRLIEASVWGNTLADAAARKTHRQLQETHQLSALIGLLERVLKADIPAVLSVLLDKLQQATAQSADVLDLAATVLPLVEVLRYGQARQVPGASLEHLLEQIVPRVVIQLPGACMGISEDLAQETLRHILGVHRSIQLWRPGEFAQSWEMALDTISNSGAPLLAGLCSRLLLEQKARTPAQTADRMAFRLSPGQLSYEAALWLEGFLQGSGLLLLHQPELWQILDRWVRDIEPADFLELLPLLRRSFSKFTGPEREKMLAQARHGPHLGSSELPADWDSQRQRLLQPLLKQILP